ncbi:hypothetical protein GYMLUDRAFT_250274 [Collybiopsis luxurians FD-317 M1]|uniref:Uncharacterized protein n=1 Tax=Collybiopsis luxurians FD-317 M1 TaxID=944289 RepID=A0A0D0C6V0_9AGAR|nr:hypothetical protein GYMLUDRAFT_250274 [Collybiopsis luxurians FD-317 M1]
MESHTACIGSVAFSSNGSKVISSADDRIVRLWNAITREQEIIVTGHNDMVYSVAFSPDAAHAENEPPPSTDPASAIAKVGSTDEVQSQVQPNTVIGDETNAGHSNIPAKNIGNQPNPMSSKILTVDNVGSESKMSSVCKASLEIWKTLHKLTEVIEPLLDGTPFKGPISLFNVISKAAEGLKRINASSLLGEVVLFIVKINAEL